MQLRRLFERCEFLFTLYNLGAFFGIFSGPNDPEHVSRRSWNPHHT